jgi:hypothetical protein
MERAVLSNTLNWRAKKAWIVFGKPLANLKRPEEVMMMKR